MKTEKTIKEWYQSVADPVLREKLLDNMNKDQADTVYTSLYDAVFYGFVARTEFRKDVCYKAKANQIPMIEPDNFVRGEMVTVWNDNEDNKQKRIYLSEIKGAMHPIITVSKGDEEKFLSSEQFYHSSYKNIEKLSHTITIGGEEKTLTQDEFDKVMEIINRSNK